jgi:hypothetical protein
MGCSMAESVVLGPMTGERLRRRNRFDRSCMSKVRHVSEQHADAVLRIVGRDDDKLHIYGCEFCGGFHIGHGH